MTLVSDLQALHNVLRLWPAAKAGSNHHFSTFFFSPDYSYAEMPVKRSAQSTSKTWLGLAWLTEVMPAISPWPARHEASLLRPSARLW